MFVSAADPVASAPPSSALSKVNVEPVTDRVLVGSSPEKIAPPARFPSLEVTVTFESPSAPSLQIPPPQRGHSDPADVSGAPLLIVKPDSDRPAPSWTAKDRKSVVEGKSGDL